MTYQVGVDPGTGHTIVAVCRERSEGSARISRVASTVFVGADGAFLVGDAAERRALTDPDRVVREAVRRIGDPTPLLVGREPVAAEVLVARLVAGMLREVAVREGAAPERVAVAHPAGWAAHKVAALGSALADHGVGPLVLVPAPAAAAVVGPLGVVGVYDFGAGEFAAAVARRTASGVELLGRPGGVERLGGADVDEVVFDHVRASLGSAWEALDASDPAVLAAVARLRRECTAAKEALSVDTEVHIPVLLPGAHTTVRLGRAEFEEAIRPVVAETVDVLRAAIASAGLTPADLADVVLVGGSSRIPLVAELVSGGLGRPVSVATDPAAAVAIGAARMAGHSPAGRRAGPAPGHGGGAATSDAAGGAATDRSPTKVGGGAADVTRPPKQARPFATATTVAAPQPRGAALIVVAGLLATVLAGGAVVVGVSRLGNNAGAATPPPTVTRTAPASTAPESIPVLPPVVADPARPRRTAAPPRPEAPPPASTTPPPRTTAPPPTTLPPTSAPPPATPPPTTSAAAAQGAEAQPAAAEPAAAPDSVAAASAVTSDPAAGA